MSDLTIPGVTSRIDTKKMIDAIMDAERVPLKRMETDVETYTKTKRIWQDLNLTVSKFKESVNELFSFNSPFNAKKGVSSDETILTAIATRKAVIEQKDIIVHRIATADRFMSGSLPKDFKVKAGTYTFQVGDKSVSFSYNGGTISDFADAINRKAGKYVSASVVNNTSTTQVILIEAKLTGSRNTLVLKDAAIEFGETSGMFVRKQTGNRDVPLDQTSVPQTSSAQNKGSIAVKDGELTMQPKSQVTLPIKPATPITPPMVLEYEVKTTLLSEDQIPEKEVPPGPDVPVPGSMTYKDIQIYNEKSVVIMPDQQETPPPARVDDLNVFAVTGNGKKIPLPPIKDTGEYTKVSVPLAGFTETVDSIVIENKNTHRVISVRNIRISDPTQRGDFVPTNAVTEARDALLELNGIEVVRESNEIADLIPEVTLNLHDASPEKIKLSIEHDREAIKSSIISFVGNYNRLLTEIDILTRAEENVIESARFLTEEERTKAYERLAILKGDSTLMQLKSRLQTFMMNSYKTTAGPEMALLVQMGIATNSSSAGNIDKTLLRGYLQINEDKLDAAIASKADLMKELFGRDSDNDLVIDSGLAWSVDNYLKPYVQTGGVFASRVSTLDNQIASKQREITSFQRHLEQYEQQLKQKYGAMEGMIDQLQKSQESLRNMNPK
ncbi:MAG: flagellar hook protein FliD [Spirochaetaceae bacterium]|nr:MAG: flagellar hook protein FliD [Spirochaetaceae bacterium]